MLNKYKIVMHHIFNEEKSVIAERMNQTIKWQAKNTVWSGLKFQIDWCDTKLIVDKYEYNNKDVHRSIGITRIGDWIQGGGGTGEIISATRFQTWNPHSPHWWSQMNTELEKVLGNKNKRNWTREFFSLTRFVTLILRPIFY